MAFKFWTDLWDGSLLGTLAKIRSELTAIQPQDSEDIIWERTQSGVKARFADALPSGGESDGESEPTTQQTAEPVQDVVMAKIASKDLLGYTVYLYANGIDQESTGTGLMFIPEVALDAEIPINSYVLAHPSSVQLTGGNE